MGQGGITEDELGYKYDKEIENPRWYFSGSSGDSIGFRIVRPVVVPAKEVQERHWAVGIEKWLKTIKRIR